MTELTRPILRQCPITCGLPTRMTEYGFSKACAARLDRIKKLAEMASSDPHAAWCRECKGQKRPAELEIINKEEMIMGTQQPAKVAAVKEYTMPTALAKVLKPMSQAEAETITIKELMKFWRRPLLKHKQAGECPCCGKIRALKCQGLCSGCNSDKVARHNLTGLALLEHLARRADGTAPTIKKSTNPAPEPSSPAASPAGAGVVESDHPSLACMDYVRLSFGLDPFTSWEEIKESIDCLFSERDRLIKSNNMLAESCEERRIKIEALIEEVASLNRLLAATPSNIPLEELKQHVAQLVEQRDMLLEQLSAQPTSEVQATTEEAIVKKWSALPVPDGYEVLTSVLQEAIDQAATGKGKDRHADGKPFHEQPILREAQAVGLGFPAGQARKKILEAVRCCQDHPDRAIADLLGAINYTAALIIAIRTSVVEQAA